MIMIIVKFAHILCLACHDAVNFGLDFIFFFD